MVDQSATHRSRGFLMPVVGGVALIGAIIAGVAFRWQLWDSVTWLARNTRTWLTEWVPEHQAQTVAIAGFAVLCFAVNWLAHVRGRLRAWIFALVVEAGLWTIFWYGLGIPSLNDLAGLQLAKPSTQALLISGAVVMGVAGAVFWFLEAREEWLKYRRQHTVDD